MSYRAEVEIIINAIDRASGELRKIGDAVSEASSRFESLKDIAKTAAGVLIGEVAHDALGALTKSLGQASENFANLELTLTRITASMGKTGDEAKKLQSEFLELAKQQSDLGFSATEAAQALESLVKAGLEGEDASKALRAALEMARIENISTSEAANLLVSTLNQFGMTAEETAKALDVLVNASKLGIGTASDFADGLSYVGTVAHQMGLTIEETTAALVLMNNAGLEASKAGRYLASMLSDLIEKGQGVIPTWENFNTLIKNGTITMEDAINAFDRVVPSLGLSKLAAEDLELAWHELTNAVEEGRISQEQIAEALKKSDVEVNRLGFSIYNADGSMKSLNEIVMELTDRLQSFGSQAERDAYLNEIFGEQSRRAVAVLVQMGGELENVTERLGEAGTASTIVNEIMDTTAGRMAKVNAESQNASLGFGGLTAQVKEAFAGFTTLLGPLASTAQALGPSLLQGAVAGLTSALPSLIANIGGVSAAFSAMGTLISTSIIPLLMNPLTLAILGIVALATTLYMAWQNNWFGIRDVTANVVSTLQGAWSGFTNWLSNAVNGFLDWFKNNWMIIFGPLGVVFSAWQNNWFGIRDIFGDVISSIQSLFSGFASWFTSGWSALCNSIKNAISGAFDFVKGIIKGIIDAVSGAVSAITGLGKTAEKTVESVKAAGPPPGYAGAVATMPRPVEKAVTATTVTTPTVVEVKSPLVVVEGSADRKTAELAAEMVKESLETVVVEPTSVAAPTKRIRAKMAAGMI